MCVPICTLHLGSKNLVKEEVIIFVPHLSLENSNQSASHMTLDRRPSDRFCPLTQQHGIRRRELSSGNDLL